MIKKGFYLHRGYGWKKDLKIFEVVNRTKDKTFYKTWHDGVWLPIQNYDNIFPSGNGWLLELQESNNLEPITEEQVRKEIIKWTLKND